jgi:hypothetical protein
METILRLGLIIAVGVGMLYCAATFIRYGRRVAAYAVAILAASLIGITAHALGRSTNRGAGDRIAAALSIADDQARAGDVESVRRILDFGIRSLASPKQPLDDSSSAFWRFAIDERIRNKN